MRREQTSRWGEALQHSLTSGKSIPFPPAPHRSTPSWPPLPTSSSSQIFPRDKSTESVCHILYYCYILVFHSSLLLLVVVMTVEVNKSLLIRPEAQWSVDGSHWLRGSRQHLHASRWHRGRRDSTLNTVLTCRHLLPKPTFMTGLTAVTQ